MGKIKLVLSASILIFVSIANADLMERDLFSSGDGLVTYDPSTGLEWLDLTETFGQRVSVVQQNIGLASLGFEIMSVSGVYTLFQSASSYRLLGESPSVVDYIFDDPISASQLLSLGPTNGDGVIRSDIRGWASNDIVTDTYDIMSGLFSGIDPSGIASQGNIKEQRIGSTADQAGANVGVYMARLVPPPTALFVNGGFEEPIVPGQFTFRHRNGFELTGWESFSTYQPGTGEKPGSVHFNSSYVPVTEGNQAVQLEWPGDWIRQDFATTVGQRYTLSLDFSPFSDTATLGITVGPASLVVTTTLFQWETHTVDFIADSDLTTLTLTNLGDLGTFPHIDNVSIVSDNVLVTIDIKPGSDPNSVNPKSKGVIPVAVLGSMEFDATQVDFTTVTFGPGDAPSKHDGHVEDVNDDGFMDMVFHFKIQETGIVCGDTEATLMGETSDDQFTGTDTVKTVGCK